jgi:hypothetical protein
VANSQKTFIHFYVRVGMITITYGHDYSYTQESYQVLGG